MREADLQIPVFGSMDPAIEYTPRLAAYAVIADPQGRIAAVKGRNSYFLPGGGSLPGESPEQTIMREVREEVACEVRIVMPMGTAVQYFYADEQHYRMEAFFFAAKFAGEAAGAGEHELHWLEAEQIEGAFYHQSHVWAINRLRGMEFQDGV